jgi:hypothetical protein
MWNAYYALTDTMNDAIFLGSIRMSFIRDNKRRKKAFIALMQDAVSEFIEKALGEKPQWPTPPRPAPEHERSKE